MISPGLFCCSMYSPRVCNDQKSPFAMILKLFTYSLQIQFVRQALPAYDTALLGFTELLLAQRKNLSVLYLLGIKVSPWPCLSYIVLFAVSNILPVTLSSCTV